MNRALGLVAAWSLVWTAVAAAAPPRVVRVTPDLGATHADPALTELRIEFDQDMDTRGGFSLCGGGEEFPTLTGRPRWESARVLVAPVSLEPARTYRLSVNCPAALNFRSAAGEAARITPIAFTTAAGSEQAREPVLAAEETERAIGALRAAIDGMYSHRDVRMVDWDAVFAEHGAALKGAATPGAFALAAARLLGVNRDVHVSVEVGPARLGTFSPGQTPNCDLRTLERMVPGWTAHNGTVWTGVLEDGTGYVLIASWPGDAAAIRPALEFIEEHADAPGMVIDVRPNGGGDELTARRLAACFVDAPAVYSRNVYRDVSLPGGWSGVLDRVVEPAAEGPRYAGPVAVLMGPACMSSNESFLLMMRACPRAVLVGEASYGSSGNPRPVDLGNGVRVLLPSWRDMLPDGTPLEGRGVIPDLGVRARPDEFLAADPVLETALRALGSRGGLGRAEEP